MFLATAPGELRANHQPPYKKATTGAASTVCASSRALFLSNLFLSLMNKRQNGNDGNACSNMCVGGRENVSMSGIERRSDGPQ